MSVNDTFYKIELRKLKSFEKALCNYQSYKIPDIEDFYKLWKSYTTLFEFSRDLSGEAYYKLYKKYANPNKSAYAERLRMYLQYSKEVSWFLMRNPISVEHYNTLVNKFQSLQNELKLVLINQLGETGYKDFCQKHKFSLENT